MWLKLLSFDAITRTTTEVCSLSPAVLGIICDMPVIKEAVEKRIGLQGIELAVCAGTHPYFNDRPITNQIACFTYRMVGEEAYKGTELFVVVWE
jgi:hypothetical protein